MVASLDSEFLQLPVLKKHILCNKVNTVKGRELQELYLLMYLFFSLDQNWLKNPNKQKFKRNQNVVSGISAAFDSVESSRTHWLLPVCGEFGLQDSQTWQSWHTGLVMMDDWVTHKSKPGKGSLHPTSSQRSADVSFSGFCLCLCPKGTFSISQVKEESMWLWRAAQCKGHHWAIILAMAKIIFIFNSLNH